MNFVDELHELENIRRKEEIKREIERRTNRDNKLLNIVIETVKSICRQKNNIKDHKINGFYYEWFDECGAHRSFREDKAETQIPNCISTSDHYGDCTRWCPAFAIDDPMVFESLLNNELTKLGFYSIKCNLIPRKNQEYIGTNIFGYPKYKLTGEISYTIWINISW